MCLHTENKDSGLKQIWLVEYAEIWYLVSTWITELVQEKSSKAILGNAFTEAENPIGFSWSRIEHLEIFQNCYFSFMFALMFSDFCPAAFLRIMAGI